MGEREEGRGYIDLSKNVGCAIAAADSKVKCWPLDADGRRLVSAVGVASRNLVAARQVRVRGDWMCYLAVEKGDPIRCISAGGDDIKIGPRGVIDVKAIALAADYVCGLVQRPDLVREIQCWNLSTQSYVDGIKKFEAYAVSAEDHRVCGLLFANKGVGCYDFMTQLRTDIAAWVTTFDPISTLSSTANKTCIASLNRFYCFDANEARLPPLATEFMAAITSVGSVVPSEVTSEASPDIDNNGLCVLIWDGGKKSDVRCTAAELNDIPRSGTTRSKITDWLAISAGAYGIACGFSQSDSRVRCWGSNYRAANFPAPDKSVFTVLITTTS